MARGARTYLIPIVIFTLVFESGCVTGRFSPKPVANHRKGFFDRLTRGGWRVADNTPHGGLDSWDQPQPDFVLKKISFQWPLRTTSVTSYFGSRGDDFHEGIDLKARTGTPV